MLQYQYGNDTLERKTINISCIQMPIDESLPFNLWITILWKEDLPSIGGVSNNLDIVRIVYLSNSSRNSKKRNRNHIKNQLTIIQEELETDTQDGKSSKEWTGIRQILYNQGAHLLCIVDDYLILCTWHILGSSWRHKSA